MFHRLKVHFAKVQFLTQKDDGMGAISLYRREIDSCVLHFQEKERVPQCDPLRFSVPACVRESGLIGPADPEGGRRNSAERIMTRGPLLPSSYHAAAEAKRLLDGVGPVQEMAE